MPRTKSFAPLLYTALISLFIGMQIQLTLDVMGRDLRIALSDLLVAGWLPILVFVYLSVWRKGVFHLLREIPFVLVLFSLWMGGSILIGYQELGIWSPWALFNKGVGWGLLLAYFMTGLLITRLWPRERASAQLDGLVVASLPVLMTVFVVYWLTLDCARAECLIRVDEGVRLHGFMENPNAFGFFLVLLLSLVAARLKADFRVGLNWRSAALVMIACALMMSGSRGAMLAAACSMAVLLLSHGRKALKPLLLVAIGLTLPYLLNAMWEITSRILDSFDVAESTNMAEGKKRLNKTTGYLVSKHHFEDGGAVERWESGLVGLRMWLESPLWGQGLGVFKERSGDLGLRPGLVLHNTIIWLLAEMGVIGVGLMGWFFTSSFVRFWRRRADKRFLAFAMILVATLVMSLTTEVMYQRHVWFLLGIGLTLVAGHERENPA